MTTLIVELRYLLDQVCTARQADSMAAVMKLEDSLNMNKQRMINLLDDSPQNAEHRTSLKSGKAFISGKEFRVNEDFIKQAIFISDQLNLDEYEAARLLFQGISQSSTINSQPIDTAIYLYHSERGHVLAIFNIILEATKNALFNSNVRSVFLNFIAGIVTEKTSNGSFVQRIIKSAKSLSVTIKDIHKFGMLESAHKIHTLQRQHEEHHSQLHNVAFQPPVQFPSDLLYLQPETTKLRIDHLNEERISLAQILYHIASLHWLPEDDLFLMLRKVQAINLADSIAPYILTAFLAAISFDYSYPEKRQGIEFSKNDEFLKKMHDQITKKSWKVNILKIAVQIQWSLFISTISNTRPSIDSALLFDREQRIELVKSAIALDAFGFMNNYLLYFKQEQSEDPKKKIKTDDVDTDSTMTLDGLIVDPDDYTKFDVFISKDFQQFVVHELEYLTQSFLHNMSEIFIAFRSEIIDREVSPEKEEDINNTLTKFLALLATIYRDRVDAGLKFWGSRSNALYSFLGFLVDYKAPQILAATFDFFGAISTGIESAFNAHTLLKIGTNKQDVFNSNLFSWGKLFASLQYFSKLIIETSPNGVPPAFPPAEEDSLCKFLYLCQQVVQYSVEARLEIWSDPLLCAHQSIITMISCPTSNRLRASLYNLLTAFCSNWGGGINDVGKKISIEVWTTLEQSDMFIPDKVMATKPIEPVASETPTFNQTSPNSLFKVDYIQQAKTPVVPLAPNASSSHSLYLPQKPAGLLRELEDGKNIKSYSEALALLNLISSLIHAPSKRDELVSGFSVISPSIPNLLGHDNNRTPGTAPYISLVVDDIFLNIKNFKYVYPDTRWKLTESCLTIIENSLMAFDIETLVDHVKYTAASTQVSSLNFSGSFKGFSTGSDKSNALVRSALLEYITRPGYDILLRILSGGSLIKEIFKIVELGKEAVTKTKNEKNDYLTRSMTRCLRIFLKVFKIQNAFVNVFMPQLSLLAEVQSGGLFKLNQYTFPVPPPTLRSLGSLMMYNTKVIVQIALMVNCDDFATLCNLSTTVLASLASQPEDNLDKFSFPNHITVPMGGIGSKLAGILVSSPDASSIIFGFSERLLIENSELITYDDYEYDMNIIPFWLAENTLCNIYRFDDFNDNEQHIPSTRIAILDMLLDNMAKEIKSPTVSEFLLGYDVKELETSGTQHKSLPTNVKHKSQLACLLSILELVNTGIDTEVDDAEEPFIRTHPLLAEKCYQLIFKLCARQSTSNATLHYLRNNTDNFLVNQFKAIACRLESCIGVSEQYFIGELESSDKSSITTDYFTLVSILNQRAWLLKLVALDLLKTDSNKTVTLELLELLYGIEENKSHESSEEELLRDMHKMQLNLTSNYQQPLWNMLEIVNSLEFKWTDGLAEEEPSPPAVYLKDFQPKKYVIQKDGYVIYDIRSIYKAIRQVQLESLVYQNLSDVERNIMETEMGSLLKRLMAENRNNEISFARLHCLRAWKQVVEVTIADCFDLLSFEARQKVIYDLLSVLLPKLENDTGLHVEILKGLGEVILSLLTRLREDKRKHSIFQVGSDSSVSRLPDERLRSVFNSIINIILRDTTTIEVRSSMYSALVNLIQYITPDKGSDEVSPKNIHNQIIENIGNGYKEQLFDIICKDASHGLNIFKTSAFKALEALYVLVRNTKSAIILGYLVKKNFLQYNISMIDRSDSELSSIINERDVSLIPLYNHEAKMSLFIQIAMTKEGSALLLSNGIVSNTSACKFFNSHFNQIQSMDVDSEYRAERHGWLLTSMLMLMNALLMSSSGQGESTEQFQFWINRQGVLVDILKDENKEPTLSSLHILHLTVSLLFQLSKQQFYFVDLEANGLSELDSLLMSLIPKYCVPEDWASVVKPSKLAEFNFPVVNVSGTGAGHDSPVATKADAYITKIRNNLLAYAEASTFRRSLDLKPVFKPVIANTLVPIEEYVPGLSTTASLTTFITCVSCSSKKITKVIAAYEILCTQKENVGSLKYEEILEIVDRAIPKRFGIKYDSLNPSQQSQVLSTEIDRRIQLKFQEIRDLVFTIETSLFILWRHLEYYLKNHTSTTITYSPCERYANENVVLRRQALFQTSPALIKKLRSSCNTVLEPVIKSLEAIPTTSRYSSSLSEMSKRIRKCYV